VDALPQELRSELDLVGLVPALREMHFPSSFEMLEKARRRIVFDEFFSFELQLFLKVRARKTQHQAMAIPVAMNAMAEFRRSLPFELTKVRSKRSDLIKDLINDPDESSFR
jgi:ATP-dependent DNA helicase RecG